MNVRSFEKSIEFSNNGQLSLFFLGTGSAFSKTYLQTNLLIIKGNHHILVDCGSLCPYALETKYNSRIKNIKNIVLTHPHADHIGGVEELAFTSYYTNKSKVNIIIPDEFKNKLWNESLRGGLQFSEKGKMNFEDYFTQYKPVLLYKKPFKMWEINFEGINLKLFRTHHVTTKKDTFKNSQFSTGLIIDNKVLFTGDSQFRKEQLDWICKNFNIETIFHDCDITGFSAGVHATYEELKTLPAQMKQKIYLCHYCHNSHETDVKSQGFAGFAEPGIYYDFD